MTLDDVTPTGADNMALKFLRDNGPHTMSQINDDEAFAAALVFFGLEKRGLVNRVDFGGGHLQFSLTPEGLATLEPTQ